MIEDIRDIVRLYSGATTTVFVAGMFFAFLLVKLFG